MADRKPATLMRSLGEFVGHIVRGFKAEIPEARRTQEIHRDVQEATSADDSVILRRTTIEEIEVRRPGSGG